jgi:hypothetical protein
MQLSIDLLQLGVLLDQIERREGISDVLAVVES